MSKARFAKVAAAVKKAGGTMHGKPEPYNTNNAWGFGGSYGDVQDGELDGVKFRVKIGTACFRHLPSEPIARVHLENEYFAVTLKQFMKDIEEGGMAQLLKGFNKYKEERIGGAKIPQTQDS